MIWFMKYNPTIKDATTTLHSCISQLRILDNLIQRNHSSFVYEQSMAAHAQDRIPTLTDLEYSKMYLDRVEKTRKQFLEGLARYSETLQQVKALLEDPIYKKAYMRIKLQGADDFPYPL